MRFLAGGPQSRHSIEEFLRDRKLLAEGASISGALSALVHSGKIRYIGGVYCKNF